MDNALFDEVHEDMPKMNPLLQEGWAVHKLKDIEEYLDRVWRAAALDFPPGLKYEGYRRCTPQEEFRVVAGLSRQPKKVFDVSNSDVYLVKYNLSLYGKPIDDAIYVYLPFARQGGIMTIRGSKYVISPVIADVGISVSSDDIFIVMNKGKVTFRKEVINVNIDGRRLPTYMIYSQIYNVKGPVPLTRVTSIPHYLFCKYGFYDTLHRMGANPVVMTHDTYDPAKYPEEHWVKFSTSAVVSITASKRKIATTPLVVCVPRSQVTHSVISVIGCFFRVADKFPDRLTIDDHDDVIIWRVLLGKFIIGQENESTILSQMNNHIDSIDVYVDATVIERLIGDGYHIKTIYDLFYIMINDYQELVNQRSIRPQAMYGKSLLVLRYVAEDITHGISNIYFAVKKEFSKKGELSLSELKRTFRTHLPYNTILSLNGGAAFVKSVSTASDCLLHKVTAIATMQTECSKKGNKKGNKKGKVATFDETQYVDPSTAELGGITNLPDRDVTGASSLNLFAMTAPDGELLENPKFKPLLDEVYHAVKRYR